MKIVFLILLKGFFSGAINDETFLIKDFLLLQNKPIRTHLFACWQNDDKIEFSKILAEKHFFDGSFQIREAVSKLMLEFAPQYNLHILDLDCPSFEEILLKAEKLQLFGEPYKWFLINYNSTKISSKYSFLIDSEVYVVSKTPNGSFSIGSIYKTYKGSREFLHHDIGVWTNGTGFEYYNSLMLSRNRSNTNGLILNISYVFTDLDSLNHLSDYRDKHIDAISKLNYVLSHYIADTMNATTKTLLQKTWGYKNQTTGIFSGMVGDLQQGFADIGGTSLFFTKDRVPYIDFVATTTPTRAKFIFRAPPLSYVTNVFTHPFDRLVWYSAFLLVAIVTIVTYVIVFWEWKNPRFRQHIENRHGVLRPEFFDVVMLQVGAICQQGAEAEPRSGAGRIATIFLFVTLMFMYTSYSANIVALLQSTTDSIKTIDDLLNSRIKLGVEDLPYSYYYFQNEKEQTRRTLYEKKIAPKGQLNNFMTLHKGIKRMREEFFAFHVECSSGYKVVSDTFQEHEKCGLMEIDVWRIIDPYSVVQKKSSFKKLVKLGFRKLHESGVQAREYKLIYTKKPVCQNGGSNFMSIGLIDCYYAFLVFGVGGFIAILLIILEVTHSRYIKKIFKY